MRAVFKIEQDETGAYVAAFLFDGEKQFFSAPCKSWGEAMDAVETLREHAGYAKIED